MRRAFLCFVVLGCNHLRAADAGQPYRAEVERWRKDQEQKHFSDLRLMIVSRFELREGQYTLGAGQSNNLVLPKGPPVLGTIAVRGKRIEIDLQPGVKGALNNQPITKGVLPLAQNNAPSNPLWVGSIGLSVRERNGRIRMVVHDKQAEFVRARKTLQWFPVQDQYRIAGKFVPFDKPVVVTIPDSEGAQREYPSPGYVSFSVGGQSVTLQPIKSGEGLFFVFRDATSGKDTYGAGRFLDADAPKDGIVILDFNKATNPLCAYNAFVICPMPPKQNRLAVAIPAGEKVYAAH